MTTQPLSHGLVHQDSWTLGLGLLLALGACSAPRAGPDRTAGQDTSGNRARTDTGVNQRLVLAAAEVALPPPGVTPDALPEPQSEGAQGVAKFCGGCHNLPTPTIHSATDWPAVVRRMWLRADRLPSEFGVAVPTTQQRQVILTYLLKDALVVSGAALPAGAGRGSFSKACSRCHATPDPRQHSPADWPTVVARMQQRMDQMKVDQPPKATLQEILAYLDDVSTNRFPPDSARKIALAKVPGGKIIEQEIRQENGRVIYSFSLRVPSRPGTEEVNIDSRTGLVLEVKHQEPVKGRTAVPVKAP